MVEKNLAFSPALMRLKEEDQIARGAWEKGFHLELEDGVIYHVEPNGDRVEWAASHEDILSDDWYVSKEAE